MDCIHVDYEMIVILVFDKIFCSSCYLPLLNLFPESRCLAVGHMAIMLNWESEEYLLLTYISFVVYSTNKEKNIQRVEPQYRTWHSQLALGSENSDRWMVVVVLRLRKHTIKVYDISCNKQKKRDNYTLSSCVRASLQQHAWTGITTRDLLRAISPSQNEPKLCWSRSPTCFGPILRFSANAHWTALFCLLSWAWPEML